jgi:hypothetical protein
MEETVPWGGYIPYAHGHKTHGGFFMKKSKLFLTEMAALLLTFGLVLTGCDNGSTDGGGGSTISLNIGSATEWDEAVTTMKGGDDGAKYAITLSDDLDLPSDQLKFTGDDAANVAITIKGEGHTIRLNAGSKGSLFALSDQTLVLEKVTLAGHDDNNKPLVAVASAALTMNDGAKISGNKGDSYGGGGGVAISGILLNGKVVGGSLTMNNGAEISGNESLDGGGVYVMYGSLTMNGGVISGNSSTGNGGGGVYVISNSSLTMNGGTISGNSASYGGGVYVTGHSSFTMKNGTISGNSATSDGGGVYVTGNNSSFTMENGTISGNSSTRDGGGVCVNENFGSFVKTGGIIYGSDATDASLKNTGSFGDAVYAGNKKNRSTTAGPDVNLDTADGEWLDD